MKNLFLLYLSLISLLFSCQQNAEKSAILKNKDVKRIVLVGGTLISGMENYGFFEKSLIQHFPANQVSLRNIGWPADDVYGLARSQFGSAQNTRSWRPPSAEEGFGSKVLMQHIEEAAPVTLMIGYGPEVAYVENDEDFRLFTSGYSRLLDFAEAKDIQLILLSPPRQEVVHTSITETERRNEWLSKANSFIKEQATTRGHHFIDLYHELVHDPSQQLYTENGVQLNLEGYEKMNEILLENLGIAHITSFSLELDEQAGILQTQNCDVSDWTKTVHGVSFNLTPGKMLYSGKIHSKGPVAIYINGTLSSKNQDTLSLVNLGLDSMQDARLLATIKEKNRLHRYRLRPLNEAYIYLFRRHEMGHLAYEMDDLKKLVEEKEREINRLLASQTYDIEIELIRPWQPPKNYPEDEVPAHIPEPNIAEELAAFNIAEGFEVSLFAADPMIANPINVNWDTRGRAWVATSSTYPHIVPGREPNDKIIILEDTDNDGVADKHTVFAENLLVPHSVMPVPGGAYVTATTELLFFADTDGDDVADERRVVYDGFGNADVHHMIHGLRWAPWGDLYFTQSIYINTFVETPFGPRILNGSGTWAFRPETESLEIFNRGLINPWGHAFDQWGQAFATDGAGSSGISYIFPESAHATAVGAVNVLPGLNQDTPKNTAAEVIYSRHFPPDWQGSMITNDFRANRTVRYQLQPKGSGYQSEEVQTVIRSDHRSYRPVDSKIGPDGALYIVDWYNPIIDHGEVDFHHPIRDKTHGRIWKLTKKGSPLLEPEQFRGNTLSNLLNLLKSPEQFTRLQANRAYVEQNGPPELVVDWIKRLSRSDRNFTRHRLEGLWLLTALNHYDEALLLASINSSDPRERAAAVRLLSYWKKQKAQQELLARLINDPHPQVRLETIHALREMGGLAAVEIAMNVLNLSMDQNLEFALDLTIRELRDAWLPKFAERSKVFNGEVNKQLYALLTGDDPRVITPINEILGQAGVDTNLTKKAWFLLAEIGDAASREKVMQKAVSEENVAMLSRMVNAPEANNAVPGNLQLLETLIGHDDLNLRIIGLQLAGRWEASQFTDQVLDRVQKADDLTEKYSALKALVAMGQFNQVKTMAQSDTYLDTRTVATTVWIEKAPEAAADHAVKLLAKLDAPELAELIFNTFRKLEEGPEILLKAMEGQTLPEPIASIGIKVVQTAGLNLFDLEEALRKAGSIQPIGMEMGKAEKEQLIEDALATGNIYRGQQIYRKKELLCATCHRVQEIGGLSGPDLSTVGSYMTPNSILESVLNPNSDIKQGYETVLLTKTNGELISGLLHRKTNNSTLIRQANSEIIEIPEAEITKVDVSPVSLMPTGLTRNLHRDELKDLLAYLVSLGVGD